MDLRLALTGTLMDTLNLLVLRTPVRDVENLVWMNHYAGGLSAAAVCYGLYRTRMTARDADLQLIGVAAFLPPVSKRARDKPLGAEGAHLVWELHRLALEDHPDERNLASWFLSRAMRGLHLEMGARVVVTFADTTEGHDGTIYRALNAIPAGKVPPRVTYVDEHGTLRSRRQNGRNISIQEALDMGWTLTRREAKHRFILVVGDGHPSRRKLAAQVRRSYGLDDHPGRSA